MSDRRGRAQRDGAVGGSVHIADHAVKIGVRPRLLRTLQRSSARAFTLIELLVVLAIVGLLASLTVPVAEITVQRSREQDLRLALRERLDLRAADRRRSRHFRNKGGSGRHVHPRR